MPRKINESAAPKMVITTNVVDADVRFLRVQRQKEWTEGRDSQNFCSAAARRRRYPPTLLTFSVTCTSQSRTAGVGSMCATRKIETAASLSSSPSRSMRVGLVRRARTGEDRAAFSAEHTDHCRRFRQTSADAMRLGPFGHTCRRLCILF